MYIPEYFNINDEEEIFTFVEANSFGQLISSVEGKLYSSHLPFLLSEDKSRLLGHLALQNPQHGELAGQEVLVTLEGPHDYISPNWYNSPGVPTWNYQALHIYGQCTVFQDPERLQEIVESLTRRYEAGFGTPWQPQYNPAMLGAIIGFEVTIAKVLCKYKLSQNRSRQDRVQVIEQLKQAGSIKLAKAMHDCMGGDTDDESEVGS